MVRKLRVAIDCRIDNPQQGIGTALLAFAKALSDSGNENQEYTFIVRENVRDWLAPYVYGPCTLTGIPEPTFSAMKASLRRIAPLRLIKAKLANKVRPIPVSDGYVESQRFDIVHFPTQTAYKAGLPTIYQPHDLQHLHYPQFFPETEVAQREREFRAFFHRATYICVQTEWTKQDLICHYEVARKRSWWFHGARYSRPTGIRRLERFGLRLASMLFLLVFSSTQRSPGPIRITRSF